MKISERNTAISLLYKDVTPYDFRVSEDTEASPIEYKSKFGLSIVREWPKMKNVFSRSVKYISNPFFEAYNKAAEKLTSVIDNEPMDESGTFITTRDGGGTNTIFYSVHASGKDKEFSLSGIIIFMGKDPNKEKPSLDIFVQRIPEGVKEYMAESCTKNKVTAFSVFVDIFSLILFMKYCQVETKVIEGQSKAHHVGRKYVNETMQKIEILDSTWFTTIIKSEGFKVGGHFRMQPFGPGFCDKKLIWIDPFEKTGYTRKAKVLNETI